MTPLVDNGNRPTACILSEAAGHRSRDNIVIEAGSGVIAPNTVLAAAEAGKYRPAAAADTAVAIALYGCDATDADAKIAGLTRDAEVNRHTLVYAATVNTDLLRAAKNTQLKAVGIIAR